MNLRELLDDQAEPSISLTGLAEHTAEVEAGYGFIASAVDDDAFLQHCRQAVDAGAVVVLCAPERVRALDGLQAAVVAVNDPGAARGRLAARFYGDPSADMVCIGCTGTNGKTSTAFHLADLSTRAGCPAAYSGTLGWGPVDALQHATTTTANAVALQRQLAAMRDGGAERVVLEISSHALDQHRAHDVHLDYGVFTNLSRDHLDYHKTEAAYGAAKTRLFTDFPLRAAVINTDDDFGRKLAEQVPCRVITYGRRGDWSWHWESAPAGLHVHWRTPAGPCEATVPMLADYAVANLTAALAVLLDLGHTLDQLVQAMGDMHTVPGRMELLAARYGRPRVIVDYAHTPDALAKVLAAIRPFVVGKLVCVVGCGGDRDAGKRPQMAQAAADGADEQWFTADNPRSEDPADIIDQMCAGLSELGPGVHICPDRALAIRGAICGAGEGDTVVIAGKGHEDYQEIAGCREPFDDRQVAAGILQEAC